MNTTTTAVATPDRIPRCRYVRRNGNPCSNPALDPDGNAIAIFGKHAAQVLELVRERKATAKRTA